MYEATNRKRPTLPILCGVVLLTLAAAAGAQTAAPLYVAFEFGDYPAALLGEAEKAARQSILNGLVEAAGARLPWHFEAADGDDDYPRLAVEIVRRQGGDNELEVTLILASGLADSRWAGGFVSEQEREDLDGFPAPTRIPDRVVERFRERILTDDRVSPTEGDLFIRLSERVPVANSAHLQPGNDRGMLPLDWSRHHLYSLSIFRTDCRNPAGEVVSLYSKGTGAPYPSEPPFSAIVVQHALWQEGSHEEKFASAHLNRLGELQPQRVFLEEFDPRGFSVPEDVDVSVTPTVADGEGGGP